MNDPNGQLYIVSTPIGNLEDITLRALRILKEVDLVAAEDTRRTLQLLNKYEIKTRLVSYHSFNEHRQTEHLLGEVAAGKKVALVSDAGTPAIADPGFLLVREAVKNGIEPVVVPGVSALTFAAAAAALPVDRFAFYGFPPVKSGRKTKFFERIKVEDKTCFLYESPHRLVKTLSMIAEVVGPETQVAVIKEATKIHEEITRGSAAAISAAWQDKTVKGEYVIGIFPNSEIEPDEED